MSTVETLLRVLIVADGFERAAGLAAALEYEGLRVVGVHRADEDLPALVIQLQAQAVVIGVDSPDRDTLAQVSRLGDSQPRPVLMLARNGDGERMQAAIAAGVSLYVHDELPRGRVQALMDAALAQFKAREALRAELAASRQELAERRLIERAKLLLMRRRGVDEPGAYRLLQRQAMDRRQRLVDVARELVSAASLLDGEPSSPNPKRPA